MDARLKKIGYDLTPNTSVDRKLPRSKYKTLSKELLDSYSGIEGTLVEYLLAKGLSGLYRIEPVYILDDYKLRNLYNLFYDELPKDIYYTYDYGCRLNIDLIGKNRVSIFKDSKGIRYHYFTPQLFGSLCIEL